jgi:hypothetical protein
VIASAKPYLSWCGIYQYPGKKQFRAGTRLLPRDLSDQQLRVELDKAFEEFFREIFPDHFERPPLVNYIPGAIFFVDEKDL